MTEPSSSPRQTRLSRYISGPFLRVLAIVVLGTLAVGYGFYRTRVQPLEADVRQTDALYARMTGLSRPVVNKLDPRFGPASPELVAGAPANPSQWIDPTPLKFSYLATDEPEKYRDAFKECCAALSKSIGRPVEYEMFTSTEDELKAVRDGSVQVAAFGTGSVPIAVDAAGFVPICCLGGAPGANGQRSGDYRVLIVARSESPIQTLDDLKGHDLGLTEPNSNSGFKAPLVLLSRDHGLIPGRDFNIRYSGGQEESIRRLAKGTFEVAAIASDVLDRAVADKAITRDQFRIIYTSEPFPPACFGCVFNLNPKLAGQIKTALLAFQWDNTGLANMFGPTGQDRFIPVSYKDDWALVRQIDDAIGNAHVLK